MPSCTVPAAKRAVPKISLTMGSGKTRRAMPAFTRSDLFPLFHSFLAGSTPSAVVVLTRAAVSAQSLLISFIDVANALNSSAFIQFTRVILQIMNLEGKKLSEDANY